MLFPEIITKISNRDVDIIILNGDSSKLTKQTNLSYDRYLVG